MPDMNAVTALLALIALAAGAAAGWALARARLAAAQASVLAERDAIAVELRATEARVAGAEARAASAEATLAAERRGAADKIELLERAQVQLKETFDSLAKDALRHNNEQFLDLADTRLKQAGAPLTETLTKVETQMREIEKERAGAQRALSDQIERVRLSGDELKRETAALVSALRKPQARGRWGELQLRRCVEFAGMTSRCDFTEQTSVQTADGLLRPDLVVRLVGGKSIVVDSKVTLAAYLEAHDAVDDLVRDERLTAHARHLRTHVDQLAAKSYWSQFSPAPEFVVLFVPGDAFLAAALDRDGDLLDYAFGKRIHIATPTTLISVLRTCAYAWQQDALAANAREVFDLGRELYLRISKLGAKVETLGKRLGSTVGAYNETVASLESRVLPQARKLRDLKVVDDELTEPRPVEEAVRPVSAAELVASAEESRAVVALPAAAEGEELDRPEDYGLIGEPERKINAG
ncbi:MAG: recombination protein RmuC [Frankiaceae bacterium]|jgi:DNA recombination protein RmuC|nr:recombination protein RmuC [Frankiaceae bacterium]